MVREHLAGGMGITARNSACCWLSANLQGDRGVGVTAVAQALHVSSAFVATETGKLAQAGLLTKRANPKDRRAVLLSLTRTGRSADRAQQQRNPLGQRCVFRCADANARLPRCPRPWPRWCIARRRATAYLNRAELATWREAAE